MVFKLWVIVLSLSKNSDSWLFRKRRWNLFWKIRTLRGSCSLILFLWHDSFEVLFDSELSVSIISRTFHFKVSAQCPGLWIEARLKVTLFCYKPFDWENSRHFVTPRLVSTRNDDWGTTTEIPYWWRVATQIWVALLIGRVGREICFNQKHKPDLGSDVSSVSGNFCSCCSNAISWGNQWWRHGRSSVISGYCFLSEESFYSYSNKPFGTWPWTGLDMFEQVCNRTRSPSAALLFESQATKHATVEWPDDCKNGSRVVANLDP